MAIMEHDMVANPEFFTATTSLSFDSVQVPPVGFLADNESSMPLISALADEKIRFGIYGGVLTSLAAGHYLNVRRLGHLTHNPDDVDLWVHHEDFDDAVKITGAEVEEVKYDQLAVDGYRIRFQTERAHVQAGGSEIEFCRQKTPIFARRGQTVFEYPWKVNDTMASRFRLYETEYGQAKLSDAMDSILFYLILGRPKDVPKLKILLRSSIFQADGNEYKQEREKELGITADDRVGRYFGRIVMDDYRLLSLAEDLIY